MRERREGANDRSKTTFLSTPYALSTLMPCVFWPLLLQYELMSHTALGQLLEAELLLRIDQKYRGPGEIFFHAGFATVSPYRTCSLKNVTVG